jgi:hypothetical protein
MFVKHRRVFTLENLLRCPVHDLFECLPARLMVNTVKKSTKTSLGEQRYSKTDRDKKAFL